MLVHKEIWVERGCADWIGLLALWHPNGSLNAPLVSQSTSLL